MTKTLLRQLLFLLPCLAASPAASALSCKEAATESIKQVITLPGTISISSGDAVRGRLLWRSEQYTTTFRCVDAQGEPGGEDAFLYWDPTRAMAQLHPSLELGVTVNSVDNRVSGGQPRLWIGPATAPPAIKANCKQYWNKSNAAYCATSLVVSVSFSAYIRATGSPPPASGQITNTGVYDLFQVDGVNGLNTTPNSNFRAAISGLGNIRFISCNPEIRVVANAGNVIDFGRVPSSEARMGVIQKTVPFQIEVDLTHPTAGNQCDGRMLTASLSTLNPLADNATILPTHTSGFGILVSRASTPTSYIPMNTNHPLGLINGNLMRYEFLASLKWLTSKPTLGGFNAAATINVTFR